MDTIQHYTDLEAVLLKLFERRASCRSYSTMPVPLRAVDMIMRSAQGRRQDDAGRYTPSAHALYPLRLYLLSRRVSGLERGLYRVDTESSDGHVKLADAPPVGALLSASLADDACLEEAPAIAVVAARTDEALAHFSGQQADGLRGARYVDVEAGAAVQNMSLCAAAQGLGGVLVMGLDEARTAQVLALPKGDAIVCLYCMGLPANQS